ncbi:MAG: bi-domain-containing oxidoreductase [Candidatus Kapaibacterium sp.]
MLQVIQYQKKGDIVVEELPPPLCPNGGILVRTAYSLISAGTEKSSVSKAKSSLLDRAKKQPEDVKLVLEFLKKDGIYSTYKRVKSKLDSYKMLGYSASGIVVESKSPSYFPGDRVACAGVGYANHSELMAIPTNLAVKIPDNVDLHSAAYTTVASIAMQGIRQSDVRVGETVAVIGLGLIGQITVQILKASGCRVIGLDIDESLFGTTLDSGADLALPSDNSSLGSINVFTRGNACDAVIITAGTQSNQPLELALNICRKKGKVVIVGDVGMNVPRVPFYMKEIDLRISCSYGPGRYDVNYEEKGIDYPLPYVRWTENRNMSSILDLLSSGKINFNKLTTHIFKIENAASAYDLILGKVKDRFLGILLEYDSSKTINLSPVSLREIGKIEDLSVAFVGLGTFARNYLVPPLQRNNVKFAGLTSLNPVNARSAAENLGFAFYSANGLELIKDERVNTVFIATRHDTHAEFVLQSLICGKSTFVEKPLAVNEYELEKIRTVVNDSNNRLMVGFNRRFSKAFTTIKEYFKNVKYPLFMNYRINAGFIPKSHWVQQPEQGGRIIGEVCHFIDCMVFLTSSSPVSVFAKSISSSDNEQTDADNVSITITFSDGSLGNINYIAGGASSLEKEYCEVHAAGKSAVMRNFETVELLSGNSKKVINTGGKKGIDEEVGAFVNAVRNGLKMPISFDDIYNVTKTSILVLESLQTGKSINLQ